MNGLLDAIRVKPGSRSRLLERDPGDRLGLSDKDAARRRLEEAIPEMDTFQNRLWAENSRAVLLVLQGMDASGKDGTVRTVFTGVNPMGVRVASFKAPTSLELDHDYLWRVHAVCPGRGEVGVFNRSHYEDLVTVSVKEIGGRKDAAWWKRRVRQINDFERLLTEEGTTILKCFLHVSKEEQTARFRERIENPEKAWKFRAGDLEDQQHFDEFMAAYDRALTDTSTEAAPWHVVPADRNWVRNLAVAELLVATLRGLDPQVPAPSPEVLALRGGTPTTS